MDKKGETLKPKGQVNDKLTLPVIHQKNSMRPLSDKKALGDKNSPKSSSSSYEEVNMCPPLPTKGRLRRKATLKLLSMETNPLASASIEREA